MDLTRAISVRKRAVLLMAYGSPIHPNDVEPYLTHIRGGERPSSEAVADLRRRYDAIGGRSPLLEITRGQARELHRVLAEDDIRIPVFVGMKHWHPFIGDVVRELMDQGIEELIGLVLAPHYSGLSIGAYEEAVHMGLRACGGAAELTMVPHWHLEPGLIRMWADSLAAIRRARPEFGGKDARILFSAHSLPSRIVAEGDPYPSQLKETCEAIATALGTDAWTFSWQSAGSRGQWLGPSVLETLDLMVRDGARSVLSAPIGFTSDHLEVLYDLDIEAGSHAARIGLRWARAPLPNASPAFIATLAAIVRRTVAEGPG